VGTGRPPPPPPRDTVASVVRLTTRLLLVPRVRLGGAVPPLRLYDFVTCTGTTSPFIIIIIIII
jgi:hypothetical protein